MEAPTVQIAHLPVTEDMSFLEKAGLELTSLRNHLRRSTKPISHGVILYHFPEDTLGVTIDLNETIRHMRTVWFTRRDFNIQISRRNPKERKVFRNGETALDYGARILREQSRGLDLSRHPIVASFVVWPYAPGRTIKRVDLYIETTPIRPFPEVGPIEALGLSFSETRSFGYKFPTRALAEKVRSEVQENYWEKCQQPLSSSQV
jgi:hypothetical protein